MKENGDTTSCFTLKSKRMLEEPSSDAQQHVLEVQEIWSKW